MVVIRADIAKGAAAGDASPGEWTKRLFDDTAPTPVVTLDARDPHEHAPERLVDRAPGDVATLTGAPPAPMPTAVPRTAAPAPDALATATRPAATRAAATRAAATRSVASTAVGQPQGPGDDGRLATLADEVTSVLQAAHVAARELRARAEAEALDAAARLRRKAEAEAAAVAAEADRLLRAAEERAMAIRVEAERIQREAEGQAAAVRADSDRARKAMEAEMAAFKASLGDEEQQRQVLIRELEDLRTQRNEALDSYVVLRRSLRAVDVAIEKWHQDEPVSNWHHGRR